MLHIVVHCEVALTHGSQEVKINRKAVAFRQYGINAAKRAQGSTPIVDGVSILVVELDLFWIENFQAVKAAACVAGFEIWLIVAGVVVGANQVNGCVLRLIFHVISLSFKKIWIHYA